MKKIFTSPFPLWLLPLSGQMGFIKDYLRRCNYRHYASYYHLSADSPHTSAYFVILQLDLQIVFIFAGLELGSANKGHRKRWQGRGSMKRLFQCILEV